MNEDRETMNVLKWNINEILMYLNFTQKYFKSSFQKPFQKDHHETTM